MTDTSQDEQNSTPAPPPPNMVTGNQRKKRSAKGMVIMVGVVGFAGIIGYQLFLSGGNDSPIELDGQQLETSGGSAEIAGDVTEGGSGGGMRQEVAQVQSDLEDEENRLERVQNGRSSITLGEVDLDMEEEAEEETESRNTTFGAIAPEPQAAPAREPRPITEPGRRVVTMDGNGQAGPQGISNAMTAEIERLSEADNSGWHTTVNYADTTGSETQGGGFETGRMPLTPGLEERYYGKSGNEKRSNDAEYEIGELAMPGDTLFAYMRSRITSEQPGGRVVAEILQGDLKGGRVLGTSEVQGERILVNFDRLVTADGDYFTDINMQAVDASTLDSSLQDGVDRRLFVRYGLPILYGLSLIHI